MAEQNLPALQQKAQSISDYLARPYIKDQLAMALPKHLTADRLLRVAMTTIRHNRKLLDCTLESLLAAVMGCAQLGLEPEPFLGQAYLVPFNNKVKIGNREEWRMEAKLVPGYRGYIALARRSGEVQSVTSQVVYTNDKFQMEYGLEDILKHAPSDGDRGNPKGAYVIFRYKDGSHSFDYMSVPDIEKVRARSKAKDSGPWVTDWDEMAKKTVIRRHIKLVPLSIEMATAAAAEEKAFAGESQAGLFLDTQEGEFTEIEEPEAPEVDPAALKEFSRLVNEKSDFSHEALSNFIDQIAKVNKQTPEAVQAQASTPANFPTFWQSFLSWQAKQDKGRKPRSDKGSARKPQEAPATEQAPTATAGEEVSPDGASVGQEKIPQGITAEQRQYLNAVPDDLVQKAFHTIGETPVLLTELDSDTADRLIAELKRI